MKAFEKRFPIEKEWDWMGVPQDEALCNAMLATGWRAAKKHYLKWVSSMLWLADGQVVNEVKERIQQELEEE